MFGIAVAYRKLRQLKPDLIFSKGGFVSFPVVIAGKILSIPIIAHESDIIPGLTTKLCFRFVTKQCIGFASGRQYFDQPEKVIHTGTPLRPSIFMGNAENGLIRLGLNKKTKPILLCMGGSLGAAAVNQLLTNLLPKLLPLYTVIHSTGTGKNTHTEHPEGYHPFESIGTDELADFYQCADIIISRAGATTVCEITSLKKAAILIPLPRSQSRGDQIINAKEVSILPGITMIEEEQLTAQHLMEAINATAQMSKTDYTTKAWQHYDCRDSSMTVANLLLTMAKSSSN